MGTILPTMYERVTELRKSNNITMQQAADAVGISRPSYSNFEHGKKELSLTEAMKLSDLLGAPLEALVKGYVPNSKKYRQMILEFLTCAGKRSQKQNSQNYSILLISHGFTII